MVGGDGGFSVLGAVRVSGVVTSIPTSATVGSEGLTVGTMFSVGVWTEGVFDSAMDGDFEREDETVLLFFLEKERVICFAFAFDK